MISAEKLRKGIEKGWPICLGYIPIGLSFGVLAQKGGLLPWQVAFMSIVVFAGGSQFIALQMMASGSSIPAVTATAFMVNLRHLLMSSALSLHLKGASKNFLVFFSYGITDESFAVNMGALGRGEIDRESALVLNQVANFTWVASTVAGVYIGEFIPSGAFGIDYALTGMFICLLVFQLRGIIFVITAAIAAACSVAAYLLIPGNTYVILSAVTAATAGLMLKRRFGWNREKR